VDEEKGPVMFAVGDGILAMLVVVPASFTRLVHTPITVSDIGN